MSNTLLDVEHKIYNNRNIDPKSYYGKCSNKDILSTIYPHLKRLGYFLTYEGVFRKLATAVGLDTPWHHVKHLRTKKCGIDHNVKFWCYDYVPPRCLECWKVVVGPKTLKQLFQLLEVQQSLDRPSKCGIEIRYYTPRLYGGYFYNNSLDEGRSCYEVVRKAVTEHIGPDVSVILKRACTEYEMAIGPSVGWIMTDRQNEIDATIETIVDPYTPSTTGQTAECIAQVHTHWIEWAWKHQDPTVKEYIGELPLYPGTMTYHEGDINEIKADILRAKAKVKHDITPEVSDAIRIALQGFAMTKHITLKEIGTVIGFDAVNPLFIGEGMDNG